MVSTQRRPHAGFAFMIAVSLIVSLALPLVVAGPANATHPVNSCLDVLEEDAQNGTRTTHQLTAVLRPVVATPDPNNPPSCSGANQGEVPSVGNTVINFEIESGPNDPDVPTRPANSPDSPDFTCTIPAGQTRCSQPVQIAGGNQQGRNVIRAWIAHADVHDEQEGRDADANPPDPTQFGTGCAYTPDVMDPAGPRPPLEPAEPDCTDVVEKLWVHFVECEPETDSNPVDENHVITCSVRHGDDTPVTGEIVNVEYEGANEGDPGDTRSSPDDQCTTAGPNDPDNRPEGTCSVILGDEPNEEGDTGTTTWTAWTGTFSDLDEGPDAGEPAPNDPTPDEPAGGTNTPGSQGEPDNTDSGTKQWTPGAPRYLDCDDQSGNDDETNPGGGGAQSNETYTCRVSDQFGNPAADADVSQSGTQSVTVFAEVRGPTYSQQSQPSGGPQGDPRGTGVNDPDGPPNSGPPIVDPGDSTSYETPDYSCDARPPGDENEGTCTVTVRQIENELGATHICFWINTQTTNATHPCNRENGPGSTDGDDPEDPPAAVDPDEGEDPDVQQGDDDADEVRKTWVAGAPQSLDCAPEQDFNPSGTGHTVTCTALDASGSPVPGVQIDWELRGANDPDDGDSRQTPDHTCTTAVEDQATPESEAGTCFLRHGPGQGGRFSTNDAGETEYVAWIDASNTDAINESDPLEETCASTEGDEANNDCDVAGDSDANGRPDNNPGLGCPAGIEPDCTDVVEKEWGASRLDCVPESDVNPAGTEHTITCTARDEAGTPVSGTVVDAEFTGANDPDNGNNPPPDDTCTTVEGDVPTTPDVTEQPGTCQITHGDDESTNSGGETTYRMWIDDNGNDNDVPSSQTTTAQDGDPNETRDEQDNDDTDVTTKTWAASRVDCFPEVDSNPVTSSHTITCTARDENGAVVESQTVSAEATGANDPDNGNSPNQRDFFCVTGSDGTCSFTHGNTGPNNSGTTNNQTGTTTYRAWVEQDGNTNTSEADATEDRCATGTGDEQGCTVPEDGAGDEEEPDNTDVVAKNWTPVLDCEPESDTNPTGSSHQIICRASDGNGNPAAGQIVDVEVSGDNNPDNNNDPISPDFTCTTGQDGRCTITHGPAGTGSPGQTTYRAWIDQDGQNGTFEGDANEGPDASDAPGEPQGGQNVPGLTGESDNTDVVTKTWIGQGLDCSPEVDFNAQGQPHTVTCTFRGANLEALPNRNIDVEATGANDPDNGDSQTNPDFTCTTDQNGNCSFTHGPGGTGTTNGSGTTTYRAWADDNGDSNSEADQNETREQNDTDNTDVVEKRWVAGRLDCGPETDSNPAGSSHQVTCTVRDANNNLAPGVNVDVEATGANDPDVGGAGGGQSPSTPDFTCTTDVTGSCTFTHGSGNQSTNSAGTTTYQAWVDLDGENTTVEADQGEGRDEVTTPGATEPDGTDVVSKTWTAGQLDCSPETDSNPVGTTHTVTCTARDVSGNAAAGVQIDAEATGPNDPDNANSTTAPDFTCTTGLGGSCTFTHGGGGQNGTTNDPGVTTYRAWVDADSTDTSSEADASEGRDEAATAGNDAEPDDTDVVEKTWTTEPRTIDCTPKTGTNPAGTDHVVTCTVRDRNNAPIGGESVTFTESGPGGFAGGSGPTQTTDNSGNARITVTSSDGGVQTITGTLSDDLQGNEPGDVDECDRVAGDPSGSPEGRCSDTVSKTWMEPEPDRASNLTLTPEEATNPPGTEHTFTAKVTDAQGQPIEGADVTWQTSGVGDFVTTETTTDANGEAQAVVTSDDPGNQQVSAQTSPCDDGGTCGDTAVKHWGPARCTIFGTRDADVLRGTGQRDVICGFGGDDTIVGRGGPDLVLAGGGHDLIKGSNGGDTLKGGRGNDDIAGNRGRDRLRDGRGRDDLIGGIGNDDLKGGRGRDDLNGGRNRDRCRGGGGRDTRVNCER